MMKWSVSMHDPLSGDLPQHLQIMFKILRAEDRIKLVSWTLWKDFLRVVYDLLFTDSLFCPQAVRLESGWSERVRYMVVIYTNGHQDTEENIVLGMDFTDRDRYIYLWAAVCLVHFDLVIKCVKMLSWNLCDRQ